MKLEDVYCASVKLPRAGKVAKSKSNTKRDILSNYRMLVVQNVQVSAVNYVQRIYAALPNVLAFNRGGRF